MLEISKSSRQVLWHTDLCGAKSILTPLPDILREHSLWTVYANDIRGLVKL